MSASAAARSVIRSVSARSALAARISSGPKSRPGINQAFSPFLMSKQSPLFLRSPVELSCCVETMLPHHMATASALLTSMLSVSRHGYSWTAEGQSKPY